MSLLDRILSQKRADVAELRSRRLPAPRAAPRALGLRRAAGQPLRLIAEHKRRSPSAGALSQALDVASRARAYAEGGATMMSVLCDATFFGGAFEDLAVARDACDLPLLCKEFVVDEVQLDAALAFGADAALLIVRCLERARLAALIVACQDRGLTALVEVATPEEARAALDAGADHVGVNARDLDTLSMDVGHAAQVLSSLPDSVVTAHFSGLATAADVERVAASRADAALVGEALMRRDDPRPLLEELRRAAGR